MVGVFEGLHRWRWRTIPHAQCVRIANEQSPVVLHIETFSRIICDFLLSYRIVIHVGITRLIRERERLFVFSSETLNVSDKQ
jgi:hypothetical protein